MEHIAIDLGGTESQICIRDKKGGVVLETRIATKRLGAFLKKRQPSRVVLETCAEAFWVSDAAKEAGHEVRVVPATLVGSLGVGSRRTKTDRRDAQILSEVSTRIDLVSVHIPSPLSREMKSMCGMREVLVGSRTKIINCLRGWLRTRGYSLPGRRCKTFPASLRKLCATMLGPMPKYVARLVAQLEELNDSIHEADRELKELANGDERTRRLMTVPGVGPVTAVRFAAAVDEIDRFEGAHSVESYFGLVPGERSSSSKKQRTSITKAGSPAVRWVLVQAAWTAWRTRSDDPMVRWALQVANRRGKKVAICALARKLAGILYAIWRDGSRYDDQRGASAVT